MKITNISESKRRLWEYYLRNKYKSKKKLDTLVELLILEAVSEQAKKELEKT